MFVTERGAATTVVVGQPSHMRDVRRLLRGANHRLDEILNGHLPWPVRVDAGWDVLLQLGIDLDRVLRNEKWPVMVRPRVGGGQ